MVFPLFYARFQPQKPTQDKKQVSKAPAGKENQRNLSLNMSKALTQEKYRLQELEKRLAAKIKQYKDSQAKEKKPVTPQVPVPENIKTEEKMVFSFGSEVESEMAMITPKRRRSLLGQSPTMKPQLQASPAPAQLQLLGSDAENEDVAADETGGGETRASQPEASGKPPSTSAGGGTCSLQVKLQTDTQVDMPTGQMLERIRKLVVSTVFETEIALRLVNSFCTTPFYPAMV